MENSKAWWQSTAVWGAVGTIVGPVLTALGYTYDPALITESVAWMVGATTMAGGLVALIGRWKATTQIAPKA